MLIWSDNSVTECPGCGKTIIVGIMSLCATCPYDGFFYVDTSSSRGWYSSQQAYYRGDGALPAPPPVHIFPRWGV